jgi:hypothetical protein
VAGWVGFLEFACVFEGVLEKMVGCVWCFCGEFVVGCVANVDEETAVARNRKKGTEILTLFLIGGTGGHPEGLAVALTRQVDRAFGKVTYGNLLSLDCFFDDDRSSVSYFESGLRCPRRRAWFFGSKEL